MKFRRMCDVLLSALISGVLYTGCGTPVEAQWQVPNNSIPVGRGPGVTGFNSVAGSAGTGLKCLVDTVPPTFGLCGTAAAIQVGSTQVLSGTNTAPLWNNAGILANSAVNSTWSTWQSLASGSIARTVFTKNQEIIRSVFDFGAVCDGSTDDTVAFQAAIDSVPQNGAVRNSGTVIIPDSVTNICIVNGPLDLNSKWNITVSGASYGGASNAGQATIQTAIGAGSRWIDARDGHGIGFENLNIITTNLAFTGFYIDSGGNTPANPGVTFGSLSDNFRMRNVRMVTSVVNGTATYLNLNQSQLVKLDNVSFDGEGTAILGADATTGSATSASFKDVKFIRQTTQPVLGCGDSWNFINPVFEPRADGSMRGLVNNSVSCRGVSLINAWAGDSQLGGGNWIQYLGTGLTVQGGLYAGNATGTNINLASTTTGINIRGVYFFGGLNGINFNGGAQAGCDISANHFASVTNPIVNAGAVSPTCRMDGNVPSTSLLGVNQIYVGQSAQDPIARTMSGDATLASSGALTLATVNANVGSWGNTTQVGTFTVNAKGLITAAGVATITPAIGSITGLGAGCATFLATPSSTNLRGCVTDETGTGALMFATDPSFTIGGVSVTRGQYPGVNAATDATAGNIGEYVEAVVNSPGVAITSGAQTTVATLAIPTPGDWDISGVIYYVPAVTTSMTRYAASISSATNTFQSAPGQFSDNPIAAFVSSGLSFNASVSTWRVKTTTTPQNVFLVGLTTFSVSTMSAYGRINARRVH